MKEPNVKLNLAALDTGRVALLPYEYHKTYFNASPVASDTPTVTAGGAPPAPADPLVFGRKGVHGDGSCFFHALCTAQNTHNYLALSAAEQQRIGHRYRCRFIKHVTPQRWAKFLRRHKLKTKVSYEQLQRNFCNNRHWADELMIRLVSDVLHLNVMFLNSEDRKIYCGVHGERTEPMILILWLKHSHVEPVFRVREFDTENRRVGAQFMFDADEDKAVIDTVFSSYDGMCDA